ncbi:CMP-sialic acid transporter [Latimeria chalumnae]|uniref:Solute carrier family 35 member A1 n=1 Tax=Latimeria chalumnae TaxID=7897 RepID=H2ZTX2_LATCH|nr:PREDICTED: CMP-sialic acid transporter [Latimeria chalumnae]|eukprot:XP_006013700.1 PREDICTED: CMP-sialic acid transporter [Latimeria chalumnae]
MATAGKESVSLPFKLYCLTVMTFIAAAYTVALRYTRTVTTAMYFSTTAVCLTEVTKLFISVGILAKETGSLGKLTQSLRENILGSPKELLKLSVPSLVYAVQNNMAFLALSNLDAAVYQVSYQLKIPCTALCMVLMLRRSLSKMQWFSVFMLCGGVMLVQWKPAETTKVQVEQNHLLGFGAIAIAVLCSGFAGVYFEKVLKSSDTSLWVRNIQMYLSGILVTLAGVYMSEGVQVMEKGFFYGYTLCVWFVIFLASVGGLYTSVVVKYTDNIMKGFSAAAAIVLSTIASVLLFGLQITITFSVGAMLVCVSIYLYGLPKQDTTRLQLETVDNKAKERLINA